MTASGVFYPREADTHVLMNNCYANHGSTNARELAALLADELASTAAVGA